MTDMVLQQHTLVPLAIRACLVTLELHKVLQGRAILFSAVSGRVGPPRHGGVCRVLESCGLSTWAKGALWRRYIYGDCRPMRSVECGECGVGKLQAHFNLFVP